MKIKILKTCRFAFEPWEMQTDFYKDVIYDMESDKQANRLIETGYAVELKQEDVVTEKMQQQGENKAVDLTDIENKTFVSQQSKKRGRPPKAR